MACAVTNGYLDFYVGIPIIPSGHCTVLNTQYLSGSLHDVLKERKKSICRVYSIPLIYSGGVLALGVTTNGKA